MLRTKKNPKSARNSAGFTLIELMIVVAIVAILSAIVYPTYTKSIQVTRRADATAAMSLILARQENFFSTNNANTYTTNLASLGFTGGQTRDGMYTLAITPCAGGTIATCYQITATANAGSTQATDNDGIDCTVLTLTSTNIRTPAGCWKR